MPVGRTTVAYAPAEPPQLTPEEEAALAAEQAAAAPAPAPVEQTVMYQPSSPPPAEPVEAPVAAPEMVMYQPSSPHPAETAPAPAPVAEPAPAGYATEPVGGNDSVYMAAPPPSTSSYNRVDPAATSPAYQPAEPYSSVSPQVTDTINPAVEPGMSVPASERRDIFTAVNQAYQPAEPAPANTTPQTGPFGWTLDALAPLGAVKDGG